MTGSCSGSDHLAEPLTANLAEPGIVELARKEQLFRIPIIQRSAAGMFSAADLPDHIRYGVTNPRTLRRACAESRLWVALDSNAEVVGFALVDIVDDIAHLDELGVLPASGRQGIGTRLIETVIAWSRANGFPGLTLVTFRHLPWNAPFYKKLGFIELSPANTSAGLKDLLDAEARAGVDIRMRIGMILRFEEQLEVQVGPQ